MNFFRYACDDLKSYQEKMDPAAKGEADLAKNEQVIERPLTRPKSSGKTELLMRISAADQQMGYIIRFGTKTSTRTTQRIALEIKL